MRQPPLYFCSIAFIFKIFKKFYMKTKLIVLLIISGFLTGTIKVSAQTTNLNLMPVPKKSVVLDSRFNLDESFSIGIIGNKSERVKKAANRVLERIAGRTGLFLKNPFVIVNAGHDTINMIIKFNETVPVKLVNDESYNLIVNDRKIRLTAKTDIGALRGLETLLQLLSADSNGYYFQGVKIQDEPRFPWRGLMIDVSRHFMPVDVIYRNLDAMASLKMNVLHLHLSDDQGFRIECKTFPKLHEVASDGFYYTQNEIRRIIEYADERGIRVIPEFDIPGHATSWLTAYPEYASLPGPYKLQRGWGIFDPVFDPTKEATYEFFDKFFGEMSGLFPDKYFHIGGDENNGNQWRGNKQIQDFMKKHNFESISGLQAYFNSRISEILGKYGKQIIGWDEILHPGIPKNIVIQSWRGKEGLINAARNGYRAILSNGYYIDLIQPASKHYLNDPLPADIELNEEEKKLVLGGEATMWSEFVSPETIDSRIWPRTAAIAERFWSPQNINDVADMYRRLDLISFRLEELGITHEKNYGMMLRRLTGNRNVENLKILVDVIEPVKNYNRNRLRKQTQQSPLTRIVDAARPDSKTARKFRQTVSAFIRSGKDKLSKKIEHKLKLWRDNHIRIIELAKHSPVLLEILPQSENLRNVSLLGLEAVDYLNREIFPEEEWFENAKLKLENAKKPVAQTELMIIDSIELLINALADKN